MNPIYLIPIILVLLTVLAIGISLTRRKRQSKEIEERLGRFESDMTFYVDEEASPTPKELPLAVPDQQSARNDIDVALRDIFSFGRQKTKKNDKQPLNIPTGGIAAENEVDQTSSVFVTAEPVHFSSFFPESVQPGQSYILMVFAHLESARSQIIDLALNFQGMMGGKSQNKASESVLQLLQDEVITFVPQFEGIEFTPRAQVITWTPPHQSANFLFRTPATLDTDLTGRILIYHGLLIAGEISVSIKQTSRKVPKTLGKKSTFQRLDPVFASYSHRDTPVMEYFRQTRETLGQKMLVDIYDLRAGEYWQARLFEMIEESAAFQLFWSEHSAASSHCRDEWQYALTLVEERPRFIQPVWWKSPMPVPPPELEHLHFQKVNVPEIPNLREQEVAQT